MRNVGALLSVSRDFDTCISLFLNKDNSLEENIKLKDELEMDEKTAHENVKLLLRKYERIRVTFVTRYLLVVDGNVTARTRCHRYMHKGNLRGVEKVQYCLQWHRWVWVTRGLQLVPPFPFPLLSFPSSLLPFLPLPSLPLEVGPLNSARGLGAL